MLFDSCADPEGGNFGIFGGLDPTSSVTKNYHFRWTPSHENFWIRACDSLSVIKVLYCAPESEANRFLLLEFSTPDGAFDWFPELDTRLCAALCESGTRTSALNLVTNIDLPARASQLI